MVPYAVGQAAGSEAEGLAELAVQGSSKEPPPSGLGRALDSESLAQRPTSVRRPKGVKGTGPLSVRGAVVVGGISRHALWEGQAEHPFGWVSDAGARVLELIPVTAACLHAH